MNRLLENYNYGEIDDADDDKDDGKYLFNYCSTKKSSRLEQIAVSTTIDDLPNDLLLEILVRLPVKTTHQCKLVSKPWRSLISHHWFCRSFVRRHTTINNINGLSSAAAITLVPENLTLDKIPSLNIDEEDEEEESTTGGGGGWQWRWQFYGFSDLRFLSCFFPAGINVIASSKDLILFCPTDGSYPSRENVFYICNPFTRNWVKLPTIHSSEPLQLTDMVTGFLSEPHNTTVTLSSGKYFESGGFLKLYIFSSETFRWKEIVISVPPLFQLNPFQLIGFVFNRRFHWLTRIHGVFAFDPFSGSYSFIDLPAEFKDVDVIVHEHNIILGVCREQLRILRFCHHGRGCHFYYAESDYIPPLSLKVWELNSAGEWCVVHDIYFPMSGLDDDLDDDSENSLVLDPWLAMSMAFHPFNVDIVYLWLPWRFIMCNLRSGEFQLMSVNEYYLTPPTNLVFPLVQQCFPTPVTTSNSLQDIWCSRLSKLELDENDVNDKFQKS